MSEGPTWIVTAPAKLYPDERFDEPWIADPIKIGVDHPHYKPPLDPQQATPRTRAEAESDISAMVRDEQIADAARLAADDIATVMRHWTFPAISDLPNLRALLDMLTPPAPKWEPQTDSEAYPSAIDGYYDIGGWL